MKLHGMVRDRTRWSAHACSAAQVLDLLNTKTVFLVVRECFYGTTRFDDFVARVEVSAPAISRALRQLEESGIVERMAYRDPGSRERYEYRLTGAGEDLLPVFMSLVQWGDTHVYSENGPLTFTDAASGSALRVAVTADDGRGDIRSTDVVVRSNRSFRRG